MQIDRPSAIITCDYYIYIRLIEIPSNLFLVGIVAHTVCTSLLNVKYYGDTICNLRRGVISYSDYSHKVAG